MRKIALLSLSLFAAACGSSSDPAQPDTGPGTVGDSGTMQETGGEDGGGDATPDTPAAKRAACTFTKGAKVADTLGFTAADRAKLPISHVILVMKENRSFDHYFGRLPAEGRKDVEGIPAGFTNPDADGKPVSFTHETNACFPNDPEHQWKNMHDMFDGGKMDGFVKNAQAHSVGKTGSPVTTDGHFVMTYRERTDLPFYYWLTDQYALADHWFAAVLGGTWANRRYVYAANSYGVKNTGEDVGPKEFPMIFDIMDAGGVSYGIFTDEDLVLDGALLFAGVDASHKGYGKMADFYAKLADGTLPQVSFVDADENTLDEHPPADVQKGEDWTRKLYDAVTKSPIWLKDGKGVALIYTYDEAGGFADHVVPPKGCIAAPDQAEFDNLGIRVPFVMISPFAKKKYVSHKVYEHSAIARFIEMVWDLPAMSGRDANAEDLLDFFDFTGTPNATPPAPPAAGTGGCTD